jgi:hypothetical protein
MLVQTISFSWDEEQPDKAAEELKAVIRATLYGEAMTEDG